MRVRHFGNTANNAYYNTQILRDYAGIESHLPISNHGVVHAISAPAWEAIDFDVPSVAWVSQPDWSAVPGAVEFNAEYSDLVAPVAPSVEIEVRPRVTPRSVVLNTGRAVMLPLRGRRWAQPLFDASYNLILARRHALPIESDEIMMLYGADSQIWGYVPDWSKSTVCLEHGTVRWIADGDREMATFRRAYRKQVERADHLWVTNLDSRTLEIAEDVAPGKWSALPHPFEPDSRVPFSESADRRAELLRRTKSESLILLPASQNWSKHHDKGSKKALMAFVELRRQGHDVGLVAVEWGLQVAESQAFLADSGVGDNVAWVSPMARLGLQRTMADVDVVWDQFGLDAFGALALRAVEQGTPLVSRGLKPEGARLIGGPVPWRHAAETEEIVRETASVLTEILERGRSTVIAETTTAYRTWLLERHSPQITAQLQRDVYMRMAEGTFERGFAAPDQWAQLLEQPQREDGLQ